MFLKSISIYCGILLGCSIFQAALAQEILARRTPHKFLSFCLKEGGFHGLRLHTTVSFQVAIGTARNFMAALLLFLGEKSVVAPIA